MAEVGIGTAVVAYIEPHAGQEVAFNRWYERDHLYAAATAGPGCFAGARWVATRACKAVRPPDARWFGDPARGSFLTTLWILPDAQAEWDAWTAAQMGKLGREGDRMFAGRDHLQTGAYRFVGEARAPGGTSAATALDHPFAGLIAIAVPSGAGAACADALVGEHVPVTAVLAHERVIMAEAEAPAHDLVLGFTAGDPLVAWDARAIEVLATTPDVGFASPFLRTIPGTDTYVDEL
jgi:hypothetical protein